MDGEQKPNQPPQSSWSYNDGDPATPQISSWSDQQRGASQDDGVIEWTASEFIAHPKSVMWYIMLGVATVVLTYLAHIITHDVVSIAAVIFVGIMLGVFGARKPHVLPYRVDRRSISVGQRSYPFSDFKSFYIHLEGAFSSITLLPMGRFATEVSLYYEPDDEARIVKTIGAHLPMEQARTTPIDGFVRRIRL